MYLTADIGNTRIKYALWSDDRVIVETGIPQSYEELFTRLQDVHTFAWCSTLGALPEQFSAYKGRFFELDNNSRLPFKNEYKTPKTMGKDRIAAIAGASTLYPVQNVFVMDAGTCITTDFLTAAGIYKGGSISPGLEMRYRALNAFTEKLPVVKHREGAELLGLSTEESILSGVWYGILGEIQYRIENLQVQYPGITLVSTGGDAPLLANKLKYRIFAEPLIIHHGLLSCLFLNEF